MKCRTAGSAESCSLRLALQHGRDHVFAPIEVYRDFCGAAARCRSYAAHTGNRAHCFFHWRGDLYGHLLGRTITGIECDSDTRETDLGKKRDRQRKTRNCARERKRTEQKQNRTRMAVRPRGETHFFTSTAMPSSSS